MSRKWKKIKMPHPYIPNDTEKIMQTMMRTIGVKDIEELFLDIPKKIRFKNLLCLPKTLPEVEVIRNIEIILSKNKTIKEMTSFLGGGIWPHFVPSAVDSIAQRSEFLTTYTPYQPEINQGLLQALFEYQSLICELVDMDVSNCSMYDWATSLGEAARMTARITGRTEFIVPHYIHPSRLATLRSYAEPAGIKILEAPQSILDGQFNIEALKETISKQTAGIYIENPSYLGYLIHSLDDLSEITHEAGALFIVGVDPLSLGIVRPPGDYGADIVIGEGQPLGNYMNFGGPLLGIFACRNQTSFLRQMPGRIVGMTTTIDGKNRGFCLALQTREQHIRREKATSNICTNQAHSALRAAVFMALMGGEGLKKLGEIVLSLSHYAIDRLSRVKGLKVPLLNSAHFKEFTVSIERSGIDINDINQHLLQHNMLGGKPLEREFPELGTTALYCVTELHTKDQIDLLCENLTRILEE